MVVFQNIHKLPQTHGTHGALRIPQGHKPTKLQKFFLFRRFLSSVAAYLLPSDVDDKRYSFLYLSLHLSLFAKSAVYHL